MNKQTEYLERRAFNAGWLRGKYFGMAHSLSSIERNVTTNEQCRTQDWDEYRSQPVQFELPLEGGIDGYNPQRKSPHEQIGKL